MTKNFVTVSRPKSGLYIYFDAPTKGVTLPKGWFHPKINTYGYLVLEPVEESTKFAAQVDSQYRLNFGNHVLKALNLNLEEYGPVRAEVVAADKNSFVIKLPPMHERPAPIRRKFKGRDTHVEAAETPHAKLGRLIRELNAMTVNEWPDVKFTLIGSFGPAPIELTSFQIKAVRTVVEEL